MKRQLLLYLIFIGFNGFANNNLDSLLSKADEQSIIHFDTCLEICYSGITLARAQSNPKFQAAFETIIGKTYYFNGHYDSAAYYYDKAIYQLEMLGVNKELAFAYNELAKLYRRTNKFSKALETYEKALNVYQQLKDSSGIGMIYNESGVVFEKQGKLNEALARYELSYQMAVQRDDKTGQAYALNFMGNIYTMRMAFADASKCFAKALILHSSMKDTFALGWCYLDQAKFYKSSNQYHEALISIDKVNEIATTLHLPDLLEKNFYLRSTIDSMNGHYMEAYMDFYRHTTIKDSLFNEKNNVLIEELNAKYQTSRKEKLIDEQKNKLKEKNILLFSSLMLIVLCLLLGCLYLNRKKLLHEQRLQKEILKQQDIATRAVIEAEEKERVRIAADLHDGIGQLLSAAKMNLHALNDFTDMDERQKILNNALSMIDESAKEVRSVSHNIMPNALLKSGLGFAVKDFIEKLDHHKLAVHVNTIGLNDRIDTNIEIVVYRVIQECVNNVIKHSKANRLDISLINENGFLDITIEDNGVGFDLQKELQANGIGLKNIITRIKYLKGSYDIDSLIGNGTLMAFHIPVVQ